ncbi:DMP19 family protein [Flagellimonas sediminis]|nr:DMP19 family protein [Allomuricauda sediminis]
MASLTARIVSRAPGYDRSSKSPTISYRETVVTHLMKTQETLTNEELIDYVYYDIAGKYLNEKINDWSQTKMWYDTVFELSEPVRYRYGIGVLNMQVMNGGFEQYFDNDYGIFAEETLNGLKKIGAELTFALLKSAIKILNKHKEPQTDLFEFITQNKYWENEEIEQELDRLDDEYYKLEEKENLTELLGNYLRSCEIK